MSARPYRSSGISPGPTACVKGSTLDERGRAGAGAAPRRALSMVRSGCTPMWNARAAA